jgi:hypothetical protein
MSSYRGSKINHLLQEIPLGTVVLASWLFANGYSYELQRKYKESGWLESLGTAALKRKGDEVDLFGAVYTLQRQAGKNIHIGGATALALQGFAHYIKMNEQAFYLFSDTSFKIPLWLKNSFWKDKPVIIKRNFLPVDLGLIDFQVKTFLIKISSPSRAIMECLERTPAHFDLDETYRIMENLGSLKPADVQILLEQCTSVKVKRLFLYLAEKAGHGWVKYLKPDRINLGKGKRMIVKSGVYVPKYKITVPQSLI